MNITNDMRHVMRRHVLTEKMVDAIYSGEPTGATVTCDKRTEAALVARGLMHPILSDLTPKGRGVLAELKAAEGAVEETAPTRTTAIEGVVVSHAGVTKGCMPKHADDPDVRAALDALGDLRKAELTDHVDLHDDLDTAIWGAVVEPRGHGRVALYWAERGSIRQPNGDPFKVELDILADRLRAAGWAIEKNSLLCRFAWRPTTETAAPAELKANTSASQAATPETAVPTDVVDLMALIRATPVEKRHGISERLEKQLGDQERAFRLYDEAESEVVRDEQCEELRANLAEALSDAMAKLAEASNALTKLCSPEVYDVEYADTVASDDLLHQISEARRQLRLAMAVHKSIA